MSYGRDTEKLVLAKVRELLIPALAPWMEASSILDYRAWPSQRSRIAVLTVLALQPHTPTTGGDRVWIEVGITLGAQYQTTGVGLEQAERDLGEMSGAIYEALADSRNELWHRAAFETPWERPPTPADMTAVRVAFCNVRLIMR